MKFEVRLGTGRPIKDIELFVSCKEFCHLVLIIKQIIVKPPISEIPLDFASLCIYDNTMSLHCNEGGPIEVLYHDWMYFLVSRILFMSWAMLEI